MKEGGFELNVKTANYSTDLKDLYRLFIAKEMKKDTFLFQEGDKADGIYFVRSGKFVLVRLLRMVAKSHFGFVGTKISLVK